MGCYVAFIDLTRIVRYYTANVCPVSFLNHSITSMPLLLNIPLVLVDASVAREGALSSLPPIDIHSRSNARCHTLSTAVLGLHLHPAAHLLPLFDSASALPDGLEASPFFPTASPLWPCSDISSNWPTMSLLWPEEAMIGSCQL